MSRLAELAVQRLGLSGISPEFSYADADGNQFVNDGRTYVEFENGSLMNGYVVTFAPQGSVMGVAFAEVNVTIGVGARKVVGPFPQFVFNDDGRVQMTYAGNAPSAGLVVCVFRV